MANHQCSFAKHPRGYASAARLYIHTWVLRGILRPFPAKSRGVARYTFCACFRVTPFLTTVLDYVLTLHVIDYGIQSRLARKDVAGGCPPVAAAASGRCHVRRTNARSSDCLVSQTTSPRCSKALPLRDGDKPDHEGLGREPRRDRMPRLRHLVRPQPLQRLLPARQPPPAAGAVP